MSNKFKIIEKFLFFICCVLCTTIPLPLFFDGLGLNLVLQETSFPVISSFPVPIGLAASGVIFLIFYLNTFILKDEYKLLLSSKKSRITLAFIILFLSTWAYFISNNNLLRVVQLILPFLALYIVAFPLQHKKIKILIFYYIASCILLLSLHILYLSLEFGKFSTITEYEFALFMGYGIYQAFVSYPGVLSLLFSLVTFLIFVEHETHKKLILLYAWSLILITLGLAARRISIFEISVTLLFLIAYLSLHILNKNGKIAKKYLTSILLMSIASLAISFIFFKLPLFSRAKASAESGTFDSGRFHIYSKAMDLLSSDTYFLLFGYGGKSGFHNYFLDLIYSMGILPFIITIMLSFLLLPNKLAPLKSLREISTFLMAAVLSCFMLQSMLNASVTQPFYLCNFIMVLLITIFYTKNSTSTFYKNELC